jgi:hypothetical protein
MDLAWFLVVGWPSIVGYYVVKSEGRRGWGLVAVFLMLLVAAWATSIAIAMWMRVALER